MGKIFVRHGNAALDVSPELERLVNQLLDASPLIRHILENEIEEIYDEAYRQWPVRVIPPKDPEQQKEATQAAIMRKGKSLKEARAIVNGLEKKGRFKTRDAKISPQSQDSKNKLERGLLVDRENITAFVRNLAPYAWAIRTGQHTLNNLAYGTQTSNELLWKPVKKAGTRLVNVIADDMMKNARRK
jgi:actin-related protein